MFLAVSRVSRRIQGCYRDVLRFTKGSKITLEKFRGFQGRFRVLHVVSRAFLKGFRAISEIFNNFLGHPRKSQVRYRVY